MKNKFNIVKITSPPYIFSIIQYFLEFVYTFFKIYVKILLIKGGKKDGI